MPPRPEGGVLLAPAREGASTTAPSRRLRIAFVYDALFPYQKGGGERRFHEIAKRLAGRHEVHHFSWSHWGSPGVVERDGITCHGVGRARGMYGDDGRRTIREAVTFAARVGPQLARHRFDVIDCSATPYLPLYTAWPAARARRVPLVATWHEYWGEHWHSYLPEKRMTARVARCLEWGSARLADSLVAVSGFTAERVPGRLPRSVVANGYSLPASLPPVGRDPLRTVFVGRLIEDKRVDVLLDAFDRVRRQVPGATLAIIGDGPERGALEARASGLGIDPAGVFFGHVEEAVLWREMRRAAVFALPSVREGFGISLVEAMACGAVPIVARAPHSAAWTLIEDGVSGLVRAPDPEAFAEAMLSLLTHPAMAADMSAAAREHARRWDWDTIAAEMEAIYLDAAARGGRRLLPRLPLDATRRFLPARMAG